VKNKKIEKALTTPLRINFLRLYFAVKMFKILKTPLFGYAVRKPIAKFPQRSFASASNCYPGSVSQFTNKLAFESATKVFPTYRVMDEQGNILQKEDDPKVKSQMIVINKIV
jgi:hypothetical protein